MEPTDCLSRSVNCLLYCPHARDMALQSLLHYQCITIFLVFPVPRFPKKSCFNPLITPIKCLFSRRNRLRGPVFDVPHLSEMSRYTEMMRHYS